MMLGTLNATLAMLAPRMRTLIASVAVATAIAMAVPAQAQFGGRAGFAEAFVPDILQRDLPLMTSSLQLEESTNRIFKRTQFLQFEESQSK